MFILYVLLVCLDWSTSLMPWKTEAYVVARRLHDISNYIADKRSTAFAWFQMSNIGPSQLDLSH